MTMDDIRKVKEIEEKGRADKADAEARIRQALAEAEREGSARLEQTRKDAAEEGKQLLREAEERAAAAAVQIAEDAKGEGDALRDKAHSRMDDAAKYIVGRVVKS
ncbi:MAG: hypothetical protein IKN81_05495 [Oscillospiraceae bacterium]|nr:hypothetical protein [Oscillospiraceae bacterium]